MDDFHVTVRSRCERRDAALIAVVPIVLVGVFALPATVKEQFVLSTENPAVDTAYVSNFVHFGVGHVLSNVLAYLLLSSTTYLCFLLGERAQRFRVGTVAFLTVLPVALSALHVAVADPIDVYGFSGVNMAYLGFLALGVTTYLRERLALPLTLDHAMVLFFSNAILVTALAVPPQYGVPMAFGLATIGVSVYGYDAVTELTEHSTRGVRRASTEHSPGHAALAVAAVFLYYGLPFLAFPPASLSGDVIANYYVHFLGFCFGFMVPFLTFRPLDALDLQLDGDDLTT